MKQLLLAATLFVCVSLSAQIRLPQGYTCSKNTTWGQTIFVNAYSLVTVEAMARGMADVPAVIAYYKKLGYPFGFQKTIDGLWWGTGRFKGQDYYIIIEPESLFAFSAVTTDAVASDYSKFCSWFIMVIRAEKKRVKGGLIYFTDSNGKACKPKT